MGEKEMNELLGSTFETSLRISLLLNEFRDTPLDEQQICCIDFIAIYGADFGLLDENLHGNGLFRLSEFSAKSKLVSLALKKLVLNSSISFISNHSGYLYLIANAGKETVKKIHNSYVKEYQIAIREVYAKFPSLDVSHMQKQIYKMTINSLEVHNE